MNKDNRHKLFFLCLALTGLSISEFAESIGVSRQAVSQALNGSGSSKPIFTKIDEFIEDNLPSLLQKLIDTENAIDIGVYTLKEYEPDKFVLSIGDEAMEIKKESLVKLFDRIYQERF